MDEIGWTNDGKCIACTQPRRVAASTIAARVAEEMNCPLGEDVGYTIRFEDVTNPETTRIKFMTDGMLLREILTDPLLSRYSVIMIDEAHERSVYSDILLGMIKKIMAKRKDLRIIVSSATVDAEEFKNYFNTEKNWINQTIYDSVSVISIEGRQHEVDIFYAQKPVSNYITAALDTIVEIHDKEPLGDVLVFMTGQDEIDHLVGLINEKDFSNSRYELKALPLYSGLTHNQQLEVFRRATHNTRKVIVSTNIAETSVTIRDIVYVIDSGFVKIRTYNPATGMESLVVTMISQSSANQRSGRAGRVQEGKCFRLYTEADYYKMHVKMIPEIQRVNLAPVVLQLKSLGIDDFMNFEFLSPPPSSSLIRSLELLYSLGALDDNALLTNPIGQQMAELPLDPSLCKILLNSGLYGCSEQILSIAAMLSVPSVFSYPKGSRKIAESNKRKFSVYEGDHLTLLNVYNSYISRRQDGQWCRRNYLNEKSLKKAVDVRKQLQSYLKTFEIPLVTNRDAEMITKCLVSGYFSNAARLQSDGSYKIIRGSHRLHIHPNSVLAKFPPEWVIYHEVVSTSKDYMREVTKIEPKWLLEIAPDFYQVRKFEEPL